MRTPDQDRAGLNFWNALEKRPVLLVLLVIAFFGVAYLIHLYAFRS